MHTTLHVLAILLVAISMGLALAHALEYPGKLRLGRDQYFAVQQIYHPGFALGGFAEVAGLLAMLWPILITPHIATAFWLIAGAFVAVLAAHAVYWTVAFPVNEYWLGERAGGASRSFGEDWRELRDRWELSHIARAILMFFGLAMLTAALTEHISFITPSLGSPSPTTFDATLTLIRD